MRRRTGERLYSLLVRFYPPAFRRQFGPDMREYFGDELERRRRESGRTGIAKLWLGTIVDTAVHAAAEWRSAWTSARREQPHSSGNDMTRLTWNLVMDHVRLDVRYAIRSMRQRPAFTIVAAGTLALGIGANSAMFTLVRAVLLQPLPYVDSAALVRIAGASNEHAGRVTNLSRPNFKDYARDNRTLASMGAFSAGIGAFTLVDGEPERVRAVNVSAGFFHVLGTVPFTGRLFTQQDDDSDADVLVISHGLWQRRFGSDPGIIGRSVALGGGPQVVVGVLPPDFRYPQPDLLGEPEAYAPMAFGPQFARSGRHIRAIGRLKPGVTAAQAQTDLDALAARLEQLYPQDNYQEGVRVERLLDTVVGETRTGLLILFTAVVSVLLVACVNIANLLLAHGATRRKELAIRSALGAGRSRIIGQLLIENLVLAGAGGALGILLGWGTLRLVLAIGAGGIPRTDGVALDFSIVLFTLGVSIASGLAIGLIASSHASPTGMAAGLSEGTRGGATASIRSRLRSGLIAAEVAASLVLVIAAALLLQSLWRLANVPLGFTPGRVLSVDMAVPLARYPEGTQIPFYDELYRRIARLPGVRGVAGTNILPLSGGYSCDGFRIDRRSVPRGQEPCAEARSISPRFFEVMGTPIVAGRGFSEADGGAARRVVVINQAMARQFWPGEDPVGQTITYFSRGDREGPREIVGVVADTKHLTLTEQPRPMFYTPQPQPPSYHGMTLVIRAEADAAALTSAVRHEVRQMDSRIALYNIRTLDQLLGRAIAAPRFRSMVLALFALVALLLALIGVYGVIVYSVAQRTREIGIRIALGARGSSVVQMIVRQALTPVLLGLATGLALAAAVGRTLSTVLFGVSASDPLTLAVVPLMVLAVSLAASWLPALRATRVDPVAAIRSE
jgi:putative ABC transport system permease protein